MEVENTFNDYVNVGDDPVAGRISLYGGGRPGAKGLAIMKERGMIRKEIRELWGQWENPAANFVKSYVAMGSYLENNRFQRQVLADGLREGYAWKKDLSAGPHPVGWMEVAPEGSKTMNILAGVYAEPLMAEALQAMNTPLMRNTVEALGVWAAAFPLAAKTVYSTGSIMRNLWGNIPFIVANANAFRGGDKLRTARRASFAEAMKRGDAGLREYIPGTYQAWGIG